MLLKHLGFKADPKIENKCQKCLEVPKNLPMTTGFSFSPVTEQQNPKLILCLHFFPPTYWAPLIKYDFFGNNFQNRPISSKLKTSSGLNPSTN